MNKIQSLGGEVVYPVELVHPKQNSIGKAMDIIFGKWTCERNGISLTTKQIMSHVVLWPNISKQGMIQT